MSHSPVSSRRDHRAGALLGSGLVLASLAGAAGAQPAASAPPAPSARAEAAPISAGVIGVVRIDGRLRGGAGGIGVALGWRQLELDAMVLRSEQTGAYLGARYRLRGAVVRPYAALGVPGFGYDQMDEAGDTATKLAIGVRVAAGVELRVHAHVAVQVELGYEHFFGVGDAAFEADVVVPGIGVIGRL